MNGSSLDGGQRITASLGAGYASVRPPIRPGNAVLRSALAGDRPAMWFANRQRRPMVGVLACDNVRLARNLKPESGR